MSKTIDERIVSMEFDNSNFESNVKESMSTLEKLKQALNFKGATSGLEAIDKASEKVDFSGLTDAVDEIGVRFDAVQVIATTALANITNSVVNAGKQIINSLTFESITAGFQEYETQIGSIQTILSNTRWQDTTLDQVNSALDELNTYADQTIYNFTEMTRNIGTFTAAGVGLEDSVQAIKGIANLAAVSGSTSAQASNAMYQLSQALAAGKVTLMDWNSVVNAGMGGKVFQDALVRTSELLGTGAEQAIETYGSFRDSLTEGQWLTTEVLTETLKQFAGAYDEAELMSQGYTKEQAADIVAMANDAIGAATNVRTFSQLIDTTMEALGSGWTNTWEIIVGDFEEAQELFTGISNYLNDVVNESSQARNDLLQGWKDLGGRDALIQGLQNAFEGLLSVVTPIKEAFSEIFPAITSEQLVDITNKFRDFTASLKLSDETAASLKTIFTGLFSVIKMVITGIGNLIDFFGNFATHAQGAIDFIVDLSASLGDFFTTMSESLSDGSAFNELITNLGSALGDAASGVGRFLDSGIGKIGEILNGITPDTVNSLINAIATGGFVTLVKSIKDALNDLLDSTKDATGSIPGILESITKPFTSSVTGVLDSVRESLETWQENIKSTVLLKIAIAVALLANAVGQMASLDPNALRDALGAITVLFGELILSMTAFEKISSGLSFGVSGSIGLISFAAAINILASAMEKVSNLDSDAITRGVEGIAQLAAIMVVATKALSMGGGTVVKGAGQIVIMAAALKLMASVVADLAAIDLEGMYQGLQGVGVLLAEIAGFNALLKGGSNMLSASVAMIAIGAAMKIFASVISDIGSLDTDKAVQGVVAIGAIFAEISLMSHLVNGKSLLQSFLPIVAIAASLVIVSKALSNIAQLDVGQIESSVAAIGAVLGEIAIFSNVLPNGTKLIAVGLAMPVLASSLVIFATAINMLADLDIEQIGTALAGFMGSIVSLFVGIKAVSGNGASVIVLILAASAMTIMAAAIKVLSGVGILGVATSLASLAGTFIILGVAAKVLGPLAPSMFKIAAAVAAFGVSLAAIGFGAAALITGLSAALVVFVTALANVQGALNDLDPATVAVSIGVLVAAFAALAVGAKLIGPLVPSILSLSLSIAAFGLSCAAVAGSIWLIVAAFSALGNLTTEGVQSAIDNFSAVILGIVGIIPELVVGLAEILKTALLGILDVIVEVAPEIADSILQVITEVLSSLNQYGPQIIDFVLSFLIQIIDGVAARVPELVSSISNLLDQLFTAIFDAMSGWSDTETGTDAALGFLAGAVGLVVAFNAIKSLIPGAIQGAALMAIFVAEVGAVLAAFGAIQQLTGVSELINSGGDLLQSIGTAIGQFIGGIVGGVVEGATSTLPQVGTSLSEFAINIIPFLTAMQMVDESTIDGVTNLAAAIAALSGANLAESLSEFLGGQDFGDLGAKLLPFGEAMVEFSHTVSGIDVDAINAAANCGQALAALASSLPKEGGLAQAIFGETTDMATFGIQMALFGSALSAYSASVADIDVDAIVNSAQAGQALSDLASTLPKEGGLAQAIFGETTDMDMFGIQMALFGHALTAYAASVADLDVDSINNSVQAGQALSDLANSLPDSGGLVEWIFGGSDLGSFGQTMKQFGDALKAYSDSLSDVNFGIITNSVNRITQFKNAIDGTVGLDTSGIEALETGVDSISSIITTFGSSVAEVNLEQISAAITSLNNIRDFVSSLSGFDASGITSFSEAVASLGQVSLDGLVDVFSNASLASAGTNLVATLADGMNAGMANVSNAINSIVTSATAAIDSLGTEFNMAGLRQATEFATGIQNGSQNVRAQVTVMVQGAVSALNGYEGSFYAAGSNLAVGFANGISASSYRATVAARAMANAAKSAAESALDEHSPSKVFEQIGKFVGEGFVNGIDAYTGRSATMGAELANSVIAGANAVASTIDRNNNMSSIVDSFRELSDKLNGTEGEEEEATEKTSKLADALDTMADSLDEVLDRKSDLQSLSSLLTRTGVSFTEGFVNEMLSSSGQFAGALKEMTNLTDAQLQNMVDAYEEVEVYEKINDALDSMSESLDEVLDRKNDLEAINTILSRTGVTFSDSFVSELLSSSGQFAGSIEGLAQFTDDQLQYVIDTFNEMDLNDNLSEAIDALADSLSDVASQKSKLNAINKVLSRTGVTFTDDFIAEVRNSSGQFADALEGMAELTDDQLQYMVDAFEEAQLYDRINDLTDSLSERDGLIEALEASGITIEDLSEKINEFGLDATDVAGKIADFAETISDGFSKMSLDGQTTLEEFTENLEDNYVAAKDWQENLDTVFTKLGSLGNLDIVEEFRKELIEGGYEKYGQIVADLAEESQSEIYGFLQMWDYVKRQSNSISSEIYDTILTDRSDDFIKTGKSIASGLAEGIQNGTEEVSEAASLLCQAVDNEIREYYGIQSPSKLMESIGEYIDKGLANGITAETKVVNDATLNMISSVRERLETLSDDDFAFTPKITPVLDTSEYDRKAALFSSSMFTAPPYDAVSKAESISAGFDSYRGGRYAALAGALDRVGAKLDKEGTEDQAITFTQNNYSPKALNTGEIYRKTKSYISRYRSRGSNGGYLLK